MTTVYQMPKVSRKIKPKSPAPLKGKPHSINNNINENNKDTIILNDSSKAYTKENCIMNNNNNNNFNCETKDSKPLSSRVNDAVKTVKRNGNIAARSFGAFIKNLNYEKPSLQTSVSKESDWLEKNDTIVRTDQHRSFGSKVRPTEHNVGTKPSYQELLSYRKELGNKQMHLKRKDSGFEDMGSLSHCERLNLYKENSFEAKIYDENQNEVFEVDRNSSKMYDERLAFAPSNVDTDWDLYLNSFVEKNDTLCKISDQNNNLHCIHSNTPEKSIQKAVEKCNINGADDTPRIVEGKKDQSAYEFYRHFEPSCFKGNVQELKCCKHVLLEPSINESDTVYPEDIDEIEAELSFIMKDDEKKLFPFDEEQVYIMKEVSEELDDRLCPLEHKYIPNKGDDLFFLDDADKKNNLGASKEKLSPFDHQIQVKEDAGLANHVKTSTSKQSGKLYRNSYVDLIRLPISPFTVPDEILSIDYTMPSGHYTAKGRRRMFRRYKMFKEEKTAPTPAHIVQYSADELLQLGCSPVCQVTPESWTYNVQILPMICSTVSQQFDTLRYLEERSYVENHIGYVRELNMEENNHKQRETSSRERSQESKSGNTRWTPSSDYRKQNRSEEVNLDSKSDVSIRMGAISSYNRGSSRLDNCSLSVDQRLKLWPIQYQKYKGSFDGREKCPW